MGGQAGRLPTFRGSLEMLSVLIATRNGARTLPLVLDTFTRLECPESGWKLVIVDNGSTDSTKDVIHSFQRVLPLAYLFESTPGKNAALNAGLASVEGDLVVFTDDDILPRPDWVANIRAAADSQPLYSIFGGVILLRWEQPPPGWIEWTDKIATFGLTFPELREGSVTGGIWGGNMAIRAAVFKNGTRYDPSVGPRGTSYAMGSETELVRRLLRQGHKAWHVQNAVVEHFIRASQMSEAYVMARAVRSGRGMYRLSHAELPATTRRWMGVPRFLFRTLAELGISVVLAWLAIDRKKLFRARWAFNRQWGQIVEARRIHREQRTD